MIVIKLPYTSAAVADSSGGGGGGTCFIAAARRAETVFFIADWSDVSICGLLALVGFLWLGKRRKKQKVRRWEGERGIVQRAWRMAGKEDEKVEKKEGGKVGR
ncbi:hypothetical protein D1AOALGA4SA_3565 [Olavius algarvensis Delta 1 endosymbiont]|nr:hypothetical protein D1AOALGA4SA_3565 [Olavius algarvensis Delta 1 endosymbiont]